MLRRAQSRGTHRGFAVGGALAVAAALLLAGCSGSLIGDHLPTAMGGLPEGAPERPTTEQAYPAVHAMPAQRTTRTLSEAQQKALESDLVAARNRTNTDAAADGTAGNSSTSAAGKP